MLYKTYLFIFLIFGCIQAKELVFKGKYNAVVQTYQKSNIEYIASSQLAAIFGGKRFYVAEKAKEALKIQGVEFVFTVANPYVIVNGVPYNLGSTPLKEGENFYVPVEGFVRILKGMGVWDVNVAGDTIAVSLKEEEMNENSNLPVNRTKTVKKNENFIVVIDPGHGGKDPGAKGKRGTLEKNITLDIARRLKVLLEKNGIKAYLTRDKDIFLPLSTRAKFANEKRANLFISIHCNGSKNRELRGAEVFFLAPAKTNYAREAASRENASLLFEDNPPVKNTDEIEAIVASLLHTEYIRESSELAEYISTHISSKTGLQNRGVSQAGFYVLVGAFMPAVLIETAFITNPAEEKLILSPAFREKCAQGILRGILEFKKFISSLNRRSENE